MLKIASDNRTFLALAKGLANHPEFDFGVTVGKWTIKITKNASKARKIIDLFGYSYPIVLKGTGSTFLIYDSEVYLNRRFLSIFGSIPKNADKAGLGVSLVAS